jgi:DNA replication protein DnaC
MSEPQRIGGALAAHPGAAIARRVRAKRMDAGPTDPPTPSTVAGRPAAYPPVDPATLRPIAEPGPPPRVPDRYYCTLDDLEPTRAVLAARVWLDRAKADPTDPRGLLLYGPVGPGKSTIAGAIATELGAPYEASFWPVADLLAAIKREYNSPNHDRDDVLVRIAKRPLLVLDDLGVGKATEWTVRDVIAGIISQRYDARQRLIITTNLSPQKLADYLDDNRLTSRLTEMAEIVEVAGVDRRRKQERRRW